MKNLVKASVIPAIAVFTLLTIQGARTIDPIIEYVPMYVVYEEPFSEEALIEEIKKMNFKHPEIVLAQARLETGNFTSDIFYNNNNLFGMKKAYSRPTTASGVRKDHATYSHWKESLVDYALYSSAFLRYTEEEDVLDHLANYYAQDLFYRDKVENIKDSIKEEAHFHVP